jgi:hypothetical protein
VNRLPSAAAHARATVERVRILGLLLFAVASAATVYSARAMYEHTRQSRALFALLAPIAALIALAGLLLVFVPDFFG